LISFGSDIFVRMIPLPHHINGMTMPNSDCTFDVYINSNLCEEKQEQALKHELEHIKKDHFYNYDSVAINEMVANAV